LTIRVFGVQDVLRDIEKAKRLAIDKAERAGKKSMVAKLSANTPVDTGEAAAGWRVEGNSVVNDVDHIDLLNEGSSRQAPSHFIEKTVLSEPNTRPNGTVVSKK